MKVSEDKNENHMEGTSIYEKEILMENFVLRKKIIFTFEKALFKS